MGLIGMKAQRTKVYLMMNSLTSMRKLGEANALLRLTTDSRAPKI